MIADKYGAIGRYAHRAPDNYKNREDLKTYTPYPEDLIRLFPNLGTRIKRVSSNMHEEKSMEFNSLKYDFEWFKHDHLLWKDSMNFANDGGGKEDASNSSWSTYVPNDE
ncbi:hypothetical protein Tco_1264866 [Tanacetum coccineum]